MTNSEAIDILAEHAQNKADEGNELLCDALKIAIRAIKKQMPRRVEEIQSVLYRCPECGSEDVFNYCGKCGCRINWSNKEGE